MWPSWMTLWWREVGSTSLVPLRMMFSLALTVPVAFSRVLSVTHSQHVSCGAFCQCPAHRECITLHSALQKESLFVSVWTSFSVITFRTALSTKFTHLSAMCEDLCGMLPTMGCRDVVSRVIFCKVVESPAFSQPGGVAFGLLKSDLRSVVTVKCDPY